MGVTWVLASQEQVEAFKADWALGMPLKEMAALHGYRNINSVTRAAQRLGLSKRAGGPRDDAYSPGVLRGGEWRFCPTRRVQVWVEAS